MPALLPVTDESLSAASVSFAAALRSASLLPAMLPERSSVSMTAVSVPVVPAWLVSVTRASTKPPQEIALGDPARRACEAVADGGVAAGATPVAPTTSTTAQSAPNAPRRLRLIRLPHPQLVARARHP